MIFGGVGDWSLRPAMGRDVWVGANSALAPRPRAPELGAPAALGRPQGLLEMGSGERNGAGGWVRRSMASSAAASPGVKRGKKSVINTEGGAGTQKKIPKVTHVRPQQHAVVGGRRCGDQDQMDVSFSLSTAAVRAAAFPCPQHPRSAQTPTCENPSS